MMKKMLFEIKNKDTENRFPVQEPIRFNNINCIDKEPYTLTEQFNGYGFCIFYLVR